MIGRFIESLLRARQADPAVEAASLPKAADNTNPLVDLLFEQAEKAYGREAEENEGLWRTLPVFAASFGFAVALLGYGVAHAPPPSRSPDLVFVYLLLLGAGSSFAWSFRWFWLVVRPRTFRYLPPEPEIQAYGRSLHGYHLRSGGSESDASQRAARELKEFLSSEWAEAAAQNQQWNQLRARARGRTVFHLMICFAVALAANATILVREKLEPALIEGDPHGRPKFVDEQPAASPAQASVYRGGRDSPLPPRGQGTPQMSGRGKPPAAGQPAQERPAPPQPRYIEKNETDGIGRKG